MSSYNLARPYHGPALQGNFFSDALKSAGSFATRVVKRGLSDDSAPPPPPTGLPDVKAMGFMSKLSKPTLIVGGVAAVGILALILSGGKRK